ncbi:LysR family transcriptional regulator [Rudaeicoccus suwonensis]|nr:LysR family transcriptional regulator [Rudaeicoccus suwonensis]
MDLKGLTAFRIVAQTGSISGAAGRLGMTQSALSTRLAGLEKSLGVTLFERLSRGVQLTDAGARLLPFAAQINDLAEQAVAATTEAAEPESLRLGAIEIVAATSLAPLLAHLGSAMPATGIRLSTGTSAELISALRSDELDVAIVADNGDLTDLQLLRLDRLPLVLARARIRRPVTQLFGFGDGCVCADRLRSIAEQRGWSATFTELNSVDAIIGAVRAGLGATVLPRATVQGHDLDVDGIPPLPIVLAHRPRHVHAARSLKAAYVSGADHP